MKTTSTISADGSVVIASYSHIGKRMYEATVKITGTFGGGTVSIYTSYEAALTHKYAVKDETGVSMTASGEDQFNIKLGSAGQNMVYVCATMAGATNPAVTIYVDDNV